MKQSTSRTQRVIAGLLALTFMTVFVGNSLHLALFEHAHCAEHGELVHVHDDGVAHEHSHADEHSHAHDVDLLEATVIESRSDLNHEHCDLLLATQEDAIDSTESRALKYTHMEFKMQVWVRIAEPTTPQIALIRRAPKNAPPV